ncbi:protein kinase [Streptomyces sp. NPDC048603]|uniref:serine/threonine-protein kinase n=1 Tax=Streptomyces sp. NPDC048603 TaxID=3365577 RepID=UPI0037226ED2
MSELRGSGAEPLEPEDPRRIGPIPLAGRLGAGGMGRVYLGVHEGRYVAVKQLLASVVGEDPDFLRRFGHELDNLARLPAESTAELLAGDRAARPPWFATAYVPGLTLREAVDLHGGPLPPGALWRLLREAAAGLEPVHARDMVHRDLKPSNVMLTLDGLVLIDFGIARAAEQSRLTRTGMVVGTPAYMAPEQASGARGLSGATDVFALGSVLAYAACGRPPFGDESGHGVLYRIVHEEPDLEPLRVLDPELAEVVAACLDKDPDARPTAAGLLERTSEHGRGAPPPWPGAIAERLSERAAFAADVREIDVPTVPLAGGGAAEAMPGASAAAGSGAGPSTGPDAGRDADPGSAEGSGPELSQGPQGPQGPQRPQRSQEPERAAPPATPAGEQGRPERPRRSRRTRIVLAVVPVVVVAGGTTLVVQNLPHTSTPQAGGQASPSVSVSVSVAAPTAGPAAPATAGGPSAPGSSAPSTAPGGQGPGGAGGAGGTGPQQNAAGGAMTAGQDGGPGGGSGSGGAAVSGGSGGPSGPGTPGGSGTPAPPKATTKPPAQATPPPASGTGRYRNGDNGRCITQVYGSSAAGDCSDASARWTVRSASDGSFKLVNQQTGGCLYSNGLGQAVFVGDCAQDTGRLWRTGSGGSLRSQYGGGCLDLGMTEGLVTATCAGEASQRWTRS